MAEALNSRQQKILGVLVERYVLDAQPVSSQTILSDSGLRVSSATIRNELAALEDLGFVQQPHTSAGRIPTDAGYRQYVNVLMKPRSLRRSDSSRIRRELSPLFSELEVILDEACHLLSDVTRYTSVVLVPTVDHNAMRHVQMNNVNPHRMLIMLISSSGQVKHKLYETTSALSPDRLNAVTSYLNAKLQGKTFSTVKKMKFADIDNPQDFHDPFLETAFDYIQQTIPDDPNERIIVEGLVYILQHPEFSDVEKAREVVEALDDPGSVAKMLGAKLDSSDPMVIIGNEHELEPMRSCSFVGMPYRIQGEVVGGVGVVGPTRMQYADALSAVDYLTRRLEKCVSILSSM
ncbi:MAG: heat-inducible transcription repressor HrcA [Armatimonadetes bacterium CG2_30_59_28]|nr:heat-inducible transcription repressor HrcA [Armatimonadota bacterium]OIO94046.1 MAG: heat-inducible transcription repressor HrcA [Armatimonadetes bacterium CG2_30_59_28]